MQARYHVLYILAITALLAALISLLLARQPNSTGLEKSPIHEYIQRNNFPISYDAAVGEYQLVYSYTDADGTLSTSKFPLRYCPWTGAPFPPSKRNELFVKPLSNEVDRYARQLNAATTLEAVRAILGKPDVVVGEFADAKAQLIYTNVSETIDIVVQQTFNGQIEVSYLGKLKPTRHRENIRQ